MSYNSGWFSYCLVQLVPNQHIQNPPARNHETVTVLLFSSCFLQIHGCGGPSQASMERSNSLLWQIGDRGYIRGTFANTHYITGGNKRNHCLPLTMHFFLIAEVPKIIVCVCVCAFALDAFFFALYQFMGKVVLVSHRIYTAEPLSVAKPFSWYAGYSL